MAWTCLTHVSLLPSCSWSHASLSINLPSWDTPRRTADDILSTVPCTHDITINYSLGTQIVNFWALSMILCRCIAKFCILKSKWDNIGFLDPLRVNEKTRLGLHGCDMEDMKQRLIVVFDEFKMKNKTHILLAYNCEYVFSAFNFMLLFSLRLFDN